jgi:hypothetical protein
MWFGRVRFTVYVQVNGMMADTFDPPPTPLKKGGEEYKVPPFYACCVHASQQNNTYTSNTSKSP